MATLANDGVYNKAHFVKSVKIGATTKTGKFKPYKNEQLKPKEAFSTDVVAAIDHVLQKIPSKNGRDAEQRSRRDRQDRHLGVQGRQDR